MAKTLREKPERCPGCYTLDLYCRYDNPEHGFRTLPWSMHGKSYADCARQARGCGWILHRDRTATCPICAKGTPS